MKPFTKYWDGDKKDEYSDRHTEERKANARHYLDDCNTIIDLGCGVGNDVAFWTEQGKYPWGITYQTKEYEAARKRDLNVSLGDIQDLFFYDDSFDGMFCYDALEHCPCPFIALCEASRVVKPDGKGVIFIPGQQWTETSYHILVPTQRQMKWLLRQSGWTLDILEDWSHRQEEMAMYYVINRPWKDHKYKQTIGEWTE